MENALDFPNRFYFKEIRFCEKTQLRSWIWVLTRKLCKALVSIFIHSHHTLGNAIWINSIMRYFNGENIPDGHAHKRQTHPTQIHIHKKTIDNRNDIVKVNFSLSSIEASKRHCGDGTTSIRLTFCPLRRRNRSRNRSTWRLPVGLLFSCWRVFGVSCRAAATKCADDPHSEVTAAASASFAAPLPKFCRVIDWTVSTSLASYETAAARRCGRPSLPPRPAPRPTSNWLSPHCID